MSFPINTVIPDENNDPGDDQPRMRQNYANISGFLSVDHIAPGATGDGQHEKVTYHAFVDPGTPIGQVAVAHTQASEEDATAPNLRFLTADNSYLLNSVKAWGNFTTSAAVNPPVNNGYNVNIITRNSATNYDVTLNSNVLRGSNPTIFVLLFSSSNSVSLPSTTSITGSTINITQSGGFGSGTIVNFLVLEN